MIATVQAVFENGVLLPLAPLDLADGQTVQVVVSHEKTAPPQDAAAILAEIAALPVEGGGDPFTSRNHDQVLYGGKNGEAVEMESDSRKAEDLSDEEYEALLDSLCEGPDLPILPDSAFTREGIYEGG